MVDIATVDLGTQNFFSRSIITKRRTTRHRGTFRSKFTKRTRYLFLHRVFQTHCVTAFTSSTTIEKQLDGDPTNTTETQPIGEATLTKKNVTIRYDAVKESPTIGGEGNNGYSLYNAVTYLAALSCMQVSRANQIPHFK